MTTVFLPLRQTAQEPAALPADRPEEHQTRQLLVSSAPTYRLAPFLISEQLPCFKTSGLNAAVRTVASILLFSCYFASPLSKETCQPGALLRPLPGRGSRPSTPAAPLPPCSRCRRRPCSDRKGRTGFHPNLALTSASAAF